MDARWERIRAKLADVTDEEAEEAAAGSLQVLRELVRQMTQAKTGCDATASDIGVAEICAAFSAVKPEEEERVRQMAHRVLDVQLNRV
jgi:hypothetical protein